MTPRGRAGWLLAGMLAASPPGGGLQAQSRSPTALDRLLEQVGPAERLFVHQRDAIAGGYRRVGTDFPGMGEHWVLPAALFAGRLDPAHPSLLVYATLAGEPRLVGVGFIVPVRGDSVPRDLPGWPEAWHEHSGLLADESGVAVGHRAPTPGATRIWVMHAWVGLANPGGVNEADNWALPFARAGLPVPPEVEVLSGRAMSLIVGGDAYLRDLLADAGIRTADNAATVDLPIALAAARVEAIAERARPRGMVAAADLADLRGVWASLTLDLRGILGDRVEPYLSGAGSHAH